MTTASIVTYRNSVQELVRVLRSALASPISKLYIIDHSPGDEVSRYLKSDSVSGQDATEVEKKEISDDAVTELRMLLADSRISFSRHPNRGYGAGHNVAIRRSIEEGAEYHAVLNPDIYWDDVVISTLTAYMDNHPEVGMMTPKVLYPDGSLQRNCKMLPTPLDLIGRRFLPKKWMLKRNARFELHSSGYDHIMNVPYIHGCFMLMRNATLQKTGLFDERFFMYPEDIDITRRMHAVSETLFYPGVSIYHTHGAASHKIGKMLWIHITNMVRYFNKWGWWRDPERRKVNMSLKTLSMDIADQP